ESLSMFREAGDRWGIAGSLADLGLLAREQGDLDLADRLYAESLAAFQDLDYKRGIAKTLDAFAGSTALRSQPQRALRHALGAVLLPPEQARLEKDLEPARAALDNAEGSAAWMEGWGMPLEEAIREAADGESKV
ncbi:MAG TPA: hypothetical protein VGQ32_12565, partial [Thermoanaerobaculia bacterium]|nr:hypothetical protein [Thermoanaerobaculia bacterium]